MDTSTWPADTDKREPEPEHAWDLCCFPGIKAPMNADGSLDGSTGTTMEGALLRRSPPLARGADGE